MTAYVFNPKTLNPYVDWTSPDIWAGGVAPDSPTADVSIPQIFSGSSAYPYTITTPQNASLQENSIDLVGNGLMVLGNLSMNQSLSLQSGAVFSVGASGLVTAGSLQNHGGDVNGAGALAALGGASANSGRIAGGGLRLNFSHFTNAGSLEANTDGLSLTVSPGQFANLSGATLTGGVYKAQTGPLRLSVGSPVSVVDAEVDLAEGGSLYVYDPAKAQFVSLLDTLTTIGEAGGVSIENFYALGATRNFGAVVDDGAFHSEYAAVTFKSLEVGPTGAAIFADGTVLVNGTLLLRSGAKVLNQFPANSSRNVNNPVITAKTIVISSGAAMSGPATISAPVENEGKISSGLHSEIFGHSYTAPDKLLINGDVSGGGMLEIDGAIASDRGGSYLEGGSIELNGATAQTVNFAQGLGTLKLDEPANFFGVIEATSSVITDFQPFPPSTFEIVLADVPAAQASDFSYSYAGNSLGGVLAIQSGSGAYSLRFRGDYHVGDFALKAVPGSLSTLPSSLDVTVTPRVPSADINHDYNSDGKTDVLWRGAGGETVIWSMNNNQIVSSDETRQLGPVFYPGSDWAIAGTGDFNGDGRSDILLRGGAGEVAIWDMSGPFVSGADQAQLNGSPFNPGTYWKIAGTGDFDGDGKTDILWRGGGGEVAIWDMNGFAIASADQARLGCATFNPGAYWSIAGTGDFNGDGSTDILWRGSGGELTVWDMNDKQIAAADQVTFNGSTYNPGTYWSVAGTGDFNGDGKTDVLWRGGGGELAIWTMDNNRIVGADQVTFNGSTYNPGTYWSVAGTGDYNGDGMSDVLWRGAGGEAAIWDMNDVEIAAADQVQSGGAAFNPGAYWQIANPKLV